VRRYDRRYGYHFIVCATGKSAEQMLDILRSRMNNKPDDELLIAKEQLRLIAQIRLAKLPAAL
jgi:2-oxo-4-hydroxy-4-carboxy--5-ureidoimidazoline (OHCU) decarboxylase